MKKVLYQIQYIISEYKLSMAMSVRFHRYNGCLSISISWSIVIFPVILQPMQILKNRNIIQSCQLETYREKKRKMIRFCHYAINGLLYMYKVGRFHDQPEQVAKDLENKIRIFDKSATGGQPMVSLTSQWIVVIHNKFTNHWPSPDAHIGETNHRP